jgi:branched-chain amino acid transport system permease protein/neutral amino acid transport system permease protein
VLAYSIGFGLVTASILALAAVGFTLQFGVTNILNLAFGDLMTASALVGYGVNVIGGTLAESLLAGAVFGAIASTLLNRYLYTPFVRHGTKLFGMVIVTLSTGIVIQNLILGWFGANFFSYKVAQTKTYHIVGMYFTSIQFMIMGLAIAVMIIVQLLLTQTRLGKAMRATAANPGLAQASGIATDRVIDVAWLMSGALCGLAGVVLVLNTTSFQSTTGNDFLVVIIAAAMLGGVGRPLGALVGAVILGVATEVSAAYMSPSYKEVIAFVVLVIVLLVRPGGLFGNADAVRSSNA